MEKITATQILDHCKAVVEGKADPNGCEVEQRKDGYYITFCGFGTWVYSNFKLTTRDIVKAARLLGLDRPSPVVLEWVQDEMEWNKGSRWVHTVYNEYIRASFLRKEDGNVAIAFVKIVATLAGIASVSMPIKNEVTEAQSRAWCEEQITKIITPTPKP